MGDPMTVWLVRAGRYGEWETLALEQGLSVIGWEELPDLSPFSSREQMEQLVREIYPDASKGRVSNWTGQIWAFRGRMQIDDLVVLPLKKQSAVAIGRISGPYAFRSDLSSGVRHTRPTSWVKTDIPRSRFDQDLLYSLGAFMTVCQVQRNNAEERIKAILSGQAPPPRTPEETEGTEAPVDLELFAQDDISQYIAQRFKGHELTRLADAILTAQGYYTMVSPAGPDGGIDIVAGAGPMGFDSPRLGVQVKSGDAPVDVKVLRELQGALKNFGANQGLLVSWGGFTGSLLKEARRLHFEIRLWDAGSIVSNLLRHYDSLPPEIQADLPLKRIWVRVPKVEGDEA
jgi:restriction system protein